MHDDLAGIRVDYAGGGFHAEDAGTDPMGLFGAWFRDASSRTQVAEPNAMSLATAGPDGAPSVRMVLLKAVDPVRGAFTWYTNLESRKARESLDSGAAALCWWWPGTPGRQVRAAGRVELVDRDVARAYFERRPADARIGAAASRQSRAVASRSVLDARARSIDAAQVVIPEHWGGIRLVADELEFWQGRPGRLHDRIAFLRLTEEGTIRSRVAAASAGGDQAAHAAGTLVTDPHGTGWLRVRLEP